MTCIYEKIFTKLKHFVQDIFLLLILNKIIKKKPEVTSVSIELHNFTFYIFSIFKQQINEFENMPAKSNNKPLNFKFLLTYLGTIVLWCPMKSVLPAKNLVSSSILI